MSKRILIVLLMGTFFLFAACTAEPAVSNPASEAVESSAVSTAVSETEDAVSSAPASGDAEYIYVGTLVYDAVEFTVENDFDMDDHKKSYFKTARGDVHFSNGSTLWPGSVLGGDNMARTTEFEKHAQVAFRFETELEEDDLAEALERFVEENPLFDGTEQMEVVCYVYSEEYIVLLFPTERIAGKEIWFRLAEGEDRVLAPKD